MAKVDWAKVRGAKRYGAKVLRGESIRGESRRGESFWGQRPMNPCGEVRALKRLGFHNILDMNVFAEYLRLLTQQITAMKQ